MQGEEKKKKKKKRMDVIYKLTNPPQTENRRQ
jgi:hypothetical protein